jgi:hypothetical protein
MSDVEMTRALERGEIANENFRHASHLHVAWVYLSETTSVDQASARMRDTLQRFAASVGKPEKYHETITLFWIRFLVWMRAVASGKTLEEIVESNPQLLEKNFPLAYYSRERLFSDKARTMWLEPDLKPISLNAITSRSSSSPGNAPNRPLP